MTGVRTGILFVVGTPIGNLGDVTERSREVLGFVDVIAAEDTRRTGSLLARLGITERPRFVSLFEGNERERTVDWSASSGPGGRSRSCRTPGCRP